MGFTSLRWVLRAGLFDRNNQANTSAHLVFSALLTKLANWVISGVFAPTILRQALHAQLAAGDILIQGGSGKQSFKMLVNFHLRLLELIQILFI